MQMNTENLDAYREGLFTQFGRMGRALASPRRLELLDLLCQAERTVEDLTRHTGLSVSSVSQHLAVLRGAKLVASRKRGLFVFYRLADPMVGSFWGLFRQVALRCLPEVREMVRTYNDDPEALEPIGLPELQERLAGRTTVLLDVRPEVEFEAGHLPGAISIPLDELPRRLGEIPRDQQVVAYCRGPFCIMARAAVQLLRGSGRAAYHLREGVAEWSALGRDLETTGLGALARRPGEKTVRDTGS
jgi:DNA-binding transcriptional ArsR family regulator